MSNRSHPTYQVLFEKTGCPSGGVSEGDASTKPNPIRAELGCTNRR